MSRCHDVIVTILNVLTHFFGNSAHLARNRRKVIFEGRKLRIRASCITVRSNDAIKRVQSHACMSFAEHEHLRC